MIRDQEGAGSNPVSPMNGKEAVSLKRSALFSFTACNQRDLLEIVSAMK
jgi:hypothetical protein